MATELPKLYMSDGRVFYVDKRLTELRNVENPHDTISLLEPLSGILTREELNGLVAILTC